jgi:hypothetical protein
MTKPDPPSGYVPAPTCRLLLRSIAHADVIYLAFPRFSRALIIDLRDNEVERPVMLVTDIHHMHERQMTAVQSLRPGFPTMHAFASVAWGGSTRAFAEQGILPALLDRLPAAYARDAMAVFDELREAERAKTTTRRPLRG